ncbi:MAG: DegT/DnrJ/EryC1/StrS family aminotransferase [Patescibacteria group bacterium]|nr:DegT/DnrJ/EryC1/StrS family aminotransferase [Patescibacteria group bacterium]
MYFTHPQIQLNIKNITSALFWFCLKPNTKKIQKKLTCYFPNKKIIFTDMGRTSFQIIIEKMNLKNTTMLIPAYVCDVFFPILKKYNISPIFIDANIKTFNLDIKKLEEKIRENTRAQNPKKLKSILVSHIYGLPNNMKEISRIAQKHNLKIIEDCAHCFGARQNNKYLGNFGDASFFSLYKSFPCFRGGMLVCPKNWNINNLKKTNFTARDFISFLNCFPIFAYLFKKIIGSIAPSIVKKNIRKEKSSDLRGINNVSLNIFSHFLNNYEKTLKNRVAMALFFQQKLKKLNLTNFCVIQEKKDNVFCFISVLIFKNRDKFSEKLKKDNVFSTRIWHSPIVCNMEVEKKYNLNKNDFPNTKIISQKIINLPFQNFYTKKDIEKIISILQRHIS